VRKVQYGVSMRRARFTHSDREWDISREGFAELRRAVEALLSSIVSAARGPMDERPNVGGS
jgi:hypothetical protein